jgi:hypothetical protein
MVAVAVVLSAPSLTAKVKLSVPENPGAGT